ncbi:MAG: hypothetical protein GWN84_18030 [Gammaproteobacteria bacterium]|nr:hypothetical protein [Gammaproteobacteria bacterium]NIR84740.1 hypothetical protein [Gammaproteobacteria bacterium]NIR91236.1 hypothetical protein [Gammaproteobacteria bacterium]NIU05783.1 hypothetical protein [Gammaproteobacteria bacterium]NIV52902.1 hypothetical protein [Gammaproteobacteria bacterium]
MHIAMPLLAALLALLSVNTNAAVREVNCNAPDNPLTETLAAANPGDRITLVGICEETITITTDRLTIEGKGMGTIDGGDGMENAVTIDGARDITLNRLFIQNGNEGILGINGATFTVTNTVVRRSVIHGIELVNASADLTNVTSQSNGRAGVIIARNSVLNLTDSTMRDNLTGLVVFSNSVVRLFGTNVMVRNDTQGFTVGLGGAAFEIGSELRVDDNGAEGVFVLQDGNVQLIGGNLTATRNGTDGIRLLQNSSLIVGITEFGVPGQATINLNAGNGINVQSGSVLDASSIMELVSRNNGASGIRFDDRSSGTISGADIRGNNGADIELTFGSQATVNETVFDKIVCDETVLFRGDTSVVCPFP